MSKYTPELNSEQKSFITPEQCRGARAMLNWTQAELAEAAGVGRSKLRSFEGEKGRRAVTDADLTAIADALVRGGAVLVPAGASHTPGVALQDDPDGSAT